MWMNGQTDAVTGTNFKSNLDQLVSSTPSNFKLIGRSVSELESGNEVLDLRMNIRHMNLDGYT